MNALPELIRRFSALPEAFRAAALSAAGDAAAQAVQIAQGLVPVRTGALKASIAAETLPDGALIRAERPYAAVVELGSLHSAPHPYLLPAARQADFPARAARAAKEVLP